LDAAAAFPADGVDEPENKRADERSAAEKSFMGSEVKVNKVAQAFAAGPTKSRIFAYYSLCAPTSPSSPLGEHM
jgi:hypothetical protein